MAGTLDEPEDMDNLSLAGVIPASTVIGPAQPCPSNPEHPIRSGLGAYAPGERLDAILASVLVA